MAQGWGCVLFADVSGSTKLYETVGDAAAHTAIDRCVSLFKAQTAENVGRVIKTIGDEVMSVFPSADGAARAAMAMQRGVDAMPAVEGQVLGCRIGFNAGSLVERDGDVFGDVVNLAARLAGLASRGQILTALEVVEMLDPLLKMDCRRLYGIPVKGKEKETILCEMLWSDTGDTATKLATQFVKRTASRIRLAYGERTINLPEERKSLVLGRDATADLVIPDPKASRAHCEIALQVDKFILTDRSANGTYVNIDGDREVVLQREAFALRGHGFITLGQSGATATERVEFTCE
jgi:adenylate cyclase